MDTTVTLTGGEARRKVRAGVSKIYNTVKRTLGPEGKNALLPRTFNRGPRITNDGITVIELARQLKDSHERLVAEAFAEGSKRTNELAGDGTTATSVIAGSLYLELSDKLPNDNIPSAFDNSSIGVRKLRKEMKDAKDEVVNRIKEMSTPISTLDDLKNVAVVSIGKEDKEASDKVAELVWDIARGSEGEYLDNHIDVVEGYKGELEVEKTEGLRFPAKLASKWFINRPEKFEMVCQDVHVLITNQAIENPMEMVLILQNLMKGGVSQLAIFAPSYSSLVLQSLIKTAQGGYPLYPILAPSLRTEQLEDLATYTNATVINKESRRLGSVTVQDCGYTTRIVVKDTEIKDDAILLGGRGHGSERVKNRIQELKGQLVEAKTELSKMVLERRIANLGAAVGVIRVGASTSAEQLYLKLKIEDGVNACKAALQEGYVKGGGLCLKEIAEQMPENVLTNALKSPHAQILENAGGTLEIGEEIIDPTKVIRLEVEHAIAIASQLLTTDILIADEADRPVYDGYETVARAIAKGVFYDAKHRGLLKESEDEAEADRERMFEEALLTDKG